MLARTILLPLTLLAALTVGCHHGHHDDDGDRRYGRRYDRYEHDRYAYRRYDGHHGHRRHGDDRHEPRDGRYARGYERDRGGDRYEGRR